MVKVAYRYLLIIIAVLSIAIGILGIFLPILPGTPFFILALACFDRSSPTFHKKLLNFPYIGKRLHAWEKDKKIEKKRKKEIYLIILISFFVSIFSLAIFPIAGFSLLERQLLQLLLLTIMLIILFFIYRINEK